MNKLLLVKCKKLEYCLVVHSGSKMVKNPVPILWNYDGLYGWIPIEIVKNEIQQFLDVEKICHENLMKNIYFNWQQAHRLRPDVGKMLEELANDRV